MTDTEKRLYDIFVRMGNAISDFFMDVVEMSGEDEGGSIPSIAVLAATVHRFGILEEATALKIELKDRFADEVLQ